MSKRTVQEQFWPGRIKQARKVCNGLSADEWRDLEGRIDRLLRGELFRPSEFAERVEESNELAKFKLTKGGVRMEEVIQAVNCGHWNVIQPSGPPVMYRHEASFSDEQIRMVMKSRGLVVDGDVAKPARKS